MRIGSCELCAAKDEMIVSLRQQLEDTTRSLLALTDAKAYALRYPPERPMREAAAPPEPARTLSRLRASVFQPPPGEGKTPAEIEAMFDAESDLERRLALG